MNYTVIKDTREKKKKGWNFPPYGQCLGTRIETVKTGDYTLEGYENIFTIERKAHSGEFAQNIIQKRFERELERLEKFELPFIVLEFNVEDIVSFPFNSTIPEKYWPDLKLTPQFIMRKLNEYMVNYKTKIVFCGGRGREFSSSLFKRVVEKYGRKED